MEKKRRISTKKIILYVLVLAVFLALVIIPFTLKEADNTVEASILSTTVERGDLNATVSFSGTLEEEKGEDVSLPEGVILTGYLVNDGEAVEEGQDIATVDPASVMETVITVQENLSYLDEQMNAVEQTTSTLTVTAPAAGRVKAVYAVKGENVSRAAQNSGALLVLSLDGKMSVTFSTEAALTPGESVLAITSDGTSLEGTVERCLHGTATVTVSDDGTAVGEAVTVTRANGTLLGEGELAIHSRWNALYTTGTVGSVSVKENQTVTAGQTLFTLNDVNTSAEFDSLAARRRKYEDVMMRLFEMYQTGTVTAPCKGVVSGTDESLVEELSSGGGLVAQLLSNAPGDAPDAMFTNRVGTVASTGQSLGLLLYDGTQPISDYKAEIAGNSAFYAALPMTVPQSFSAGELMSVPVYALSGSEWQSIGGSALKTGDTVLLAYNEGGALVWIVRIASSGGGNTTGDTPSGDTSYDISGLDISSYDFSSMMGGMTQADTFTMYSLEETVVASVVPQDTVSLTVTVDEMDILSLSVGLKGQITLTALPGQSFEGTVTEIDTAGTNSGGNSKYTAVITMARQENMLSGMNASAVMVTDTHENVLLLPAEAISEEGNRTMVYTALDKDGKPASPVEVETGESDGISVEILSGLSEGETVWYSYYDTSSAESVLKGLQAQKGNMT